jgi:eukaryotic-like serine/threonine-protein kinase
MLTKRLPFVADNFAKVAILHLSQPPVPPSRLNPEVPPEIDAIVLRALEKEPVRRYQSMTEMLAALDDPRAHLLAYEQVLAAKQAIPVRSGKTLLLEPSPPAPRPDTLQHAASQLHAGSDPRGRKRLVIGGAAALVVAGAIGLAIVLQPPSPTAPTALAPVLAVGPSDAPSPSPSPSPSPPPEVVPVPDAAVDWLTVTLRSDPPGATVTRAGDVIGVTPMTMEVVRGGTPIKVEISRAGYVSVSQTVLADEPKEISVTLRAVETPRKPKRRSSDLKLPEL